jgi:hypothetical protein
MNRPLAPDGVLSREIYPVCGGAVVTVFTISQVCTGLITTRAGSGVDSVVTRENVVAEVNGMRKMRMRSSKMRAECSRNGLAWYMHLIVPALG